MAYEELYDNGKVEDGIRAIVGVMQSMGMNLLEMHQACKSVAACCWMEMNGRMDAAVENEEKFEEAVVA